MTAPAGVVRTGSVLLTCGLCFLACRADSNRPATGSLGPGERIEIALGGRPVHLSATGDEWLLALASSEGIEVRASRDEGKSWRSVVRVPRASSYAFHSEVGDHHFLVPDGGGVRHLVRAAGTESAFSSPVFGIPIATTPPAFRGTEGMAVAGIEDVGGWPQVAFAASVDHGRRWKGPVPVRATRSAGSIYGSIRLLSGPFGWVIAWADDRGRDTLLDVWITSSEDGLSWPPALRVNRDATETWQLDPALVADDEGVLVAFEDWREDNVFGDRDQNVYMTRVGPERQESRSETRIHGETRAGQLLPALARNPETGAVLVAWIDQRHRLTGDVFAATTADGGQSWSSGSCLSCDRIPARRVHHGRQPLVSPYRDGFLVGWEESWGGVRSFVLSSLKWSAEPTSNGPTASVVPSPPEPVRIVANRTPLGSWDFDSGELAGWAPRTGSWLVRRGELLGFGTDPSLLAWEGDPIRDFSLEGRFRLDPVRHDRVHWLFRTSGTNRESLRGYVLTARFRQGLLLERVDGGFTGSEDDPLYTLTDRWIPIRQGRWHEFRLEVLGERLVFHLDGEPLLGFDDLGPGDGGDLLLGTSGAPAAFDDLRLWSLEQDT